MSNHQTTYRDILEEFDSAYNRGKFVVLDGGKEIPADVRLTVYRDDSRWAVVMEQLIFYPPSPGHWGIIDCLYKFGNCLSDRKRQTADNVRATADGPNGPAFLPPYGLEVNPDVSSIQIRDKVIPVVLSDDVLRQKRIPVEEFGPHLQRRSRKLSGQHLLWSLLPENRDLLLATEEEKRRRLPPDLPKFMQLEEWYHPAMIRNNSKPSESATFQMLAEAIISGDTARYQPTTAPNTHWTNWLSYDRV